MRHSATRHGDNRQSRATRPFSPRSRLRCPLARPDPRPSPNCCRCFPPWSETFEVIDYVIVFFFFFWNSKRFWISPSLYAFFELLLGTTKTRKSKDEKCWCKSKLKVCGWVASSKNIIEIVWEWRHLQSQCKCCGVHARHATGRFPYQNRRIGWDPFSTIE